MISLKWQVYYRRCSWSRYRINLQESMGLEIKFPGFHWPGASCWPFRTKRGFKSYLVFTCISASCIVFLDICNSICFEILQPCTHKKTFYILVKLMRNPSPSVKHNIKELPLVFDLSKATWCTANNKFKAMVGSSTSHFVGKSPAKDDKNWANRS